MMLSNSATSFKIVLYYFIFSFLWIFFSDQVILILFSNDAQTISTIQTLKGWLFVFVTSALLYFLIRRDLNRFRDNQENLEVTKGLLEDTLVELKQKQSELQTLIQEAPNPIKLFNEDGKMLMVNKIWLNITGYKFEEIDTIEKWTKKAYGNKAKGVSDYIFRLFTPNYYKKRHLEHGIFKIRTHEGKYVYWQFSSVAFGVINGKKCVIASAMDVTELREKEKLILQQSKMAALGEMLENIAHQWRQPLSAILSASSGMQLKRELNVLDDASFNHSIEVINRSTKHLSKTIDDFRNFFHEDKQKSHFSIQSILDKTLAMISSKFKNRGIIIVQQVDDIEFYGLENELIQVLMNILNNAKDALELNQIDERYVFIKIKHDLKELRIEIKDNAGGVPSSIISQIFEPYFTTKHQSQGTGIGLYMSEEMVVKHMAGRIEVENVSFSHENRAYKGALFTVVLPIDSKK